MNKVEEEDYYSPALEEEAIEVECLLVEPQNDHVSVDGILCFRKENLEKCMGIEDAPYGFGGPDSNASGKGEDISDGKVLHVIPHEVEVGNRQAENGVSTTCEDYLLDIGFAESITNLDYNASEGLHLGNSGSGSQILGFDRGDNGTLVISNSSTAIIPVPEFQNRVPDKTPCKLHGNFSCKCVSETSVGAKCLKCPPSEPQNVDKLEDVSNLLVRCVSSDKKEKYMISPPGFTWGGMAYSSRIVENKEVRPVCQGVEKESLNGQDLPMKCSAQNSNVSALPTQKRLRKPNRRYMDESTDLYSRCSRKRHQISTSTSKDTFLGVRHHKHRHMASRAIPSSDESFGKAIQVPFSSQGQKECRKKHVSSEMGNLEEEPSPAESEDDSIMTVRSEENGGQRKNHRLWTLSEVRSLIDGVSHYGVGQWTQIKRLLFSSSAHRTPVDLKVRSLFSSSSHDTSRSKDKWRNLLKASSAQKQSKREEEQKRNKPWRPLPKSILRRVSELATIYPYPRGRKSNGRIVHRKSRT